MITQEQAQARFSRWLDEHCFVDRLTAEEKMLYWNCFMSGIDAALEAEKILPPRDEKPNAGLPWAG